MVRNESEDRESCFGLGLVGHVYMAYQYIFLLALCSTMIYDMMYGMCMFACSNVRHELIRCQHNHDHIYYRSIQKHRCIPLGKYSGTAWQ